MRQAAQQQEKPSFGPPNENFRIDHQRLLKNNKRIEQQSLNKFTFRRAILGLSIAGAIFTGAFQGVYSCWGSDSDIKIETPVQTENHYIHKITAPTNLTNLQALDLMILSLVILAFIECLKYFTKIEDKDRKNLSFVEQITPSQFKEQATSFTEREVHRLTQREDYQKFERTLVPYDIIDMSLPDSDEEELKEGQLCEVEKVFMKIDQHIKRGSDVYSQSTVLNGGSARNSLQPANGPARQRTMDKQRNGRGGHNGSSNREE